MKCNSCGGRLETRMDTCPFCGLKQEIDLRRLNFRSIRPAREMPCPDCAIPLEVIEFETSPPLQIERCNTCRGLFFNPGELEHLLEDRMKYPIWIDQPLLERSAAAIVHEDMVFYRKCPGCAEMMTRVNFGGRSGIILDRCGKHGVWLDGGELKQIMEWWRAGGKQIHQQQEAEAAKGRISKASSTIQPPRPGKYEPPMPANPTSTYPDPTSGAWEIIPALLELLVSWR